MGFGFGFGFGFGALGLLDLGFRVLGLLRDSKGFGFRV